MRVCPQHAGCRGLPKRPLWRLPVPEEEGAPASLLAIPRVGSLSPVRRGWWGRKERDLPEFSLIWDLTHCQGQYLVQTPLQPRWNLGLITGWGLVVPPSCSGRVRGRYTETEMALQRCRAVGRPRDDDSEHLSSLFSSVRSVPLPS